MIATNCWSESYTFVVAMANSMVILQNIKSSSCLGLTNSASGCVLQGIGSIVLRANVYLGSQKSCSQGSIVKTHHHMIKMCYGKGMEYYSAGKSR